MTNRLNAIEKKMPPVQINKPLMSGAKISSNLYSSNNTNHQTSTGGGLNRFINQSQTINQQGTKPNNKYIINRNRSQNSLKAINGNEIDANQISSVKTQH